MPPAGGFEAVKYKRNLPFRGPGGLVILGGVTAICAYGFYRVGKGNLEKRYVNTIDTEREGILVSRSWNVFHHGPRSTLNVASFGSGRLGTWLISHWAPLSVRARKGKMN